MSYTRTIQRTRRGSYWNKLPVATAPVAVPVPPYIDPALRGKLPRVRRGSITGAPAQTGTAPVYTDPALRGRLLNRRRGAYWSPVAVPANTGTQVPAPQFLARTTRVRPQARGRTWIVVPAPVNTGSQFAAPQVLGHRHRWIYRRAAGVEWTPVFPGLAPVIPPLPSYMRGAVRTRVAPVRRGQFYTVISITNTAGPQGLPPQFVRRAGFPYLRKYIRGGFFKYPVLATAPAPPILPPPPSQAGGSMGPSLGRRNWRKRRRAVKSGYDKSARMG